MKLINALFKELLQVRLKLLCLLFYSVLLYQNSFAQQEQDSNTISDNIHVAFAGGGWLAHTGHSAWVMSLLKANESGKNPCQLSNQNGNPDCLQNAFQNVKTISSNSGGTWFSTMIIYDSIFVNQITGSDALSNWGSLDNKNPNQGWLGKQQNYFTKHNFLCDCLLKKYFFGCFLETDASASWSNLVQDVVYGGYNWQQYGNLGAQNHLSWAKDKSLLMGASLLTNSVVLTKNVYFDKLYYQLCPSPTTVSNSWDNGGAKCMYPDGKTDSTPDVLPVTFSSLARNDNESKALPFINFKSTSYELGYARELDLSTSKKSQFQTQKIDLSQIPIIRASTASSAAGGFAASYNVLESLCETLWTCSYFTRKLAPSFSIERGTSQIKYKTDVKVDKMDLEKLRNERIIKIADGGSIDNSGITQLIAFLQHNNKDEDFNIVSFDNVSSKDSLSFPSTDISFLFQGVKGDSICFEGVCLKSPQLKILEIDTSKTNPMVKYSWSVNGIDSLHYYKYKVRTVINPDLNITKVQKGSIQVFSSQYSCGSIQPNDEQDFACYNLIINSLPRTLFKKPDKGRLNKTGLQLLREAFGLE